MLHLVTATVQNGKKTETITAKINARNGKGAMRVFILQSEALDAAGSNVVRLEAKPLAEQTPLGFVEESVQKAPRKARKARKPAPETTPAE